MISGTKETRPTPWPELDKIEDTYERRLKSDWLRLMERVFIVAKLDPASLTLGKAPDEDPAFTLTPEQIAEIRKALEDAIAEYALDNPESIIPTAYGEAYSSGLIRAAAEIGKDRPILDIIKNREIYEELQNNGFTRVKDNLTKAIQNQVLSEMQAHAIAGTNPLNVAQRLKTVFGSHNSNWERLARTEMADAAELAKGKEWKAWDVREVDFVPAPDACPICQALKGTYKIDACPKITVHPRCRCTKRPAASESGRQHEAVKPPQPVFVPAKTIQEANQWALSNNLADMVSYKGSSVEVANAWNKSIFEHLQQFPELRENFKFIGTTQERQRKYVELRVAQLQERYPSHSRDRLMEIAKREAGKTPGNVWAYANFDDLTKGVQVNSKFASNLPLFQSGLDQCVVNKYHPVGCNTVKSVIDHEIGHQLDKLLNIRTSQEFQRLIFEVQQSGQLVTDQLSRYATKSRMEFIAEAWAEYRNNPEPRDIAKSIGQLIEKTYNDKYGDRS